MAKQKKKQTKSSSGGFITKEAQFSFFGLFLLIISIIGIGWQGPIGNAIIYCIAYLTGVLYIYILVALAVLGLFIFLKRKMPVVSLGLYSLAFLIFFIFIMIACSQQAGDDIGGALGVYSDLFNNVEVSRFTLKNSADIATLGGGVIGFLLFSVLAKLLSTTGAMIFSYLFIFGALFIILRKPVIYLRKKSKIVAKMLPEIHLKFNKNKKIEVKEAKVLEEVAPEPTKYEEYNPFKTGGTVNAKEAPTPVKTTFVEIKTPVEKNKPLKVEHDSLYVKPSGEESSYSLPPMALLKDPKRNMDNVLMRQEALTKAETLNGKFAEFRVGAQVENFTIGPSVTRFEVRPEAGVRVSAIANIQDDVMLAMAAKSIRIEAPIPGKSVVGIEIPNRAREIVHFKDVLSTIPIAASDRLRVTIGKDIDGEAVTVRLDKMPHMLVAGATGSGKSVCINSIICSLLMRTTPQQVKLLLIDPKRVELAAFANIPHLLCPVISDAKEAATGLKRVCEEMDERYNLFSIHGQKHLEGYNANAETNKVSKLPYIVVIIDELADLMNVASREVESYIQRITQLARAAGIHLIVATQRPSVNIITGVIKANIPSRIAFAVSNGYDSKTILDSSGAEQLLGMGDMLLLAAGEISVKRVQGAFIADDEIVEIVSYIKKQGGTEYNEKFLQLTEPPVELDLIDTSKEELSDELIEKVREFVITNQRASTSLLQRYFGVGYGRAAKILDILEGEGVVGPQIGTRPREVLIKKDHK